MTALITDVVVGLVFNHEEQILVAKRLPHKHLAGLWEFPGGKKEANESAEEALQRELFEELGITVQIAQPFLQVEHQYPTLNVKLDIWQVTQFSGTPYGKENQEIAWVAKSQLQELPFPAANQTIINLICEMKT